ncbi:MAG: peptide chain release factor 2 [Butyricicoccus sp.]|nr:peptide chain release factor 2 [Butyricicoccus pullicaecorum]MCI6719651.1 peptide chain release factor 2 [Clostridiales bacterium]MDY5972212.1 peptide chain release factor 2 [Butyricicoccus sp.]
MLQFEEYKVKLNNLAPAIEELRGNLGLEQAAREVDELEMKSAQPGFWDDPEASQKVVSRMGALKEKIESFNRMHAQWEDLITLCELAIEAEDESMLEELETGYASLEEDMNRMKLSTLLTGEYDRNNALVSFHAGAGGTEAQDWCSMLYRMYTRWAERHGFTYKIMDYQDGDEAGLKSADILIEGENAYGYLKGESGVHRLVRISPFDASGRRHTSFSAVEVIPEIADDSQDIDINPADIEMQVFRSSGAGGQHINKTSSAVRLIHKPTGIVVSCQTERSQFQNRDNCMKMLRSKLVEIKEREHLDKISDIKGDQKKIEWGSQIRSYVFMPYTLAKDTRTAFENTNINAVMDGDLDGFINAYLTAAATGNWASKV